MQRHTFSRAQKKIWIRILHRAPTLQTYLFWPIGVNKRRWLTQYNSISDFFSTRCNATCDIFTCAKKIGYRPYVGSLVAIFVPVYGLEPCAAVVHGPCWADVPPCCWGACYSMTSMRGATEGSCGATQRARGQRQDGPRPRPLSALSREALACERKTLEGRNTAECHVRHLRGP